MAPKTTLAADLRCGAIVWFGFNKT